MRNVGVRRGLELQSRPVVNQEVPKIFLYITYGTRGPYTNFNFIDFLITVLTKINFHTYFFNNLTLHFVNSIFQGSCKIVKMEQNILIISSYLVLGWQIFLMHLVARGGDMLPIFNTLFLYFLKKSSKGNILKQKIHI